VFPRNLLLSLGLVMLAASCAPSAVPFDRNGAVQATDSSDVASPGTTGFSNPHGISYITNGNVEVSAALKQKDDPRLTPPPPAHATALRDRLKEFKIARYNAGDDSTSDQLRQYGNHRTDITVFFVDQDPVIFSGTFVAEDKALKLNATASPGHYTLNGTIRDSEETKEAKGDFVLKDTNTGETARIFYNAYQSKPDVTVNLDPAKQPVAGSRAANSVELFKNPNTYLWVHNWIVLGGPASYLVDIVDYHPGPTGEHSHSDASKSVAFSGSSLEIDGPAGSENDYVAEITDKDDSPCDQITMVANSQRTAARSFTCEVIDPTTKESTEFVMDVNSPHAEAFVADTDGMQTEIDQAASTYNPGDVIEGDTVAENAGALPPAPTSQPKSEETAQTPAPDGGEAQAANPPDAEQPKEKTASAAPQAPASGNSFIPLHQTSSVQRMMADFAQNINLPDVRMWIDSYRSGKLRHKMESFLYYAAPFRQMFDHIDQLYDLPPVYAMISLREGGYFIDKYTDLHYHKTHAVYWNGDIGDFGQAWGPFQIHPDTASHLKMNPSGGSEDERYYYAPAACAADTWLKTRLCSTIKPWAFWPIIKAPAETSRRLAKKILERKA
jgi:hypothetical protein